MNRTASIAILVGSLFVAGATVANAADPTQADFDACNQMARSSAQSPVSPSASPETKPHPTVPPSASAPQAAPSDKSATEARVENQADQLRGVAEASKDDARYKQAYRDCMKGRGF
jgi:hypothetical protein